MCDELYSEDVDRKRRLAILSALSAASGVAWPFGLRAEEAVSTRRLALVIGNAAYPDAPLKNSGKDANDMADTLKHVDFDVTLQLDCTLPTMRDCVRTFCDAVNRSRSAALFYFSGHALQINWRNYLLPVDLHIASPEDMPAHALDLSSVMDGLRNVGNPINIVILDACRNNPFTATGTTGRGLSQMDAPPDTLLAYATSPGNTASDGSGRNGLYTGTLLSELQRRGDAKIEDLFKRVRLSVRQASKGMQIPWESTSLESDFYFKPPKVVSKDLSTDPVDPVFEEDNRDWNKAKQFATIDSFRRYLDAHPNGKFSEIAQASLDKLLAEQGEHPVTAVASTGNPFTQGSAEVRSLVVGDFFEYRVTDQQTGLSRTSRQRVTAVHDGLVEFENGGFTTDLLGNPRIDWNGEMFGDNQLFAREYAVGKVWTTRFTWQFNGEKDIYELRCKVATREIKEVPAGRFNAFRVEAEGWKLYARARRKRTYWIAPESVPRFIALESINTNRRGAITRHDTRELISFGSL
ncbi:caspase family protein [Paraburkholderia solisilvae]|uniref:Caspase family p20 domain-containing protein n=1 Tax=Paraburkholderia solisilvae TaxID=624376 RepID=A0A6J5DS18_9BURK|nr:caspase family protein [Paraburkholderia solisilvae]CAB3756264.1 hypothetical protein LMG29739_02406 [Paraburkholderia solisilvae]